MKNIHIIINLTTVLLDCKELVSFQNLVNKGGIKKKRTKSEFSERGEFAVPTSACVR